MAFFEITFLPDNKTCGRPTLLPNSDFENLNFIFSHYSGFDLKPLRPEKMVPKVGYPNKVIEVITTMIDANTIETNLMNCTLLSTI